MPLPLEMSSDFARGSGNNNNNSSSSSSSGSVGSVWQRYVDIAFLVANCVILLGTSVVGIGANIFVTWAVYHQKSLRTWNNALLVNLAVIDFLRCAVDCPVILVIVLNVHLRGQADAVVCDLQLASFSFSCCIQLVTLACISAERYQAIAHPFKIAERKRRIVAVIPLTWVFAIAVAAVCVAFVRDSPVYVKCRGPRFESAYRDTFGLYVLIPLWSACFALIIGFYSSIFAIVTAHSRKIYDKGVNLPPKEEKKEEEKKEEKTAEEMPASQTDEKQTTAENVAQVEKVEHCKSKVSIMEPAGAPQKPTETETVSVLPVPLHNEKVAVPIKETDKPPDEKLLKPPKPTPKDAMDNGGGCKTTTKGRVAEAGSSEAERKTPLAGHPVTRVQEQQPSSRETDAHPGTDKGPGKKGQNKIRECKPPSPVPVAPKGPAPSKKPGGPEEHTVLPPLIDLEQGKISDQVVALPAANDDEVVVPTMVGLPTVKDQAVGLPPPVEDQVVPTVVGLPAVNDDVVPRVVGLPPPVKDQAVGLPATNGNVVPMVVVGLPAADTVDNQDLCMVSVVRRPPAPVTTDTVDNQDLCMVSVVRRPPAPVTTDTVDNQDLCMVSVVRRPPAPTATTATADTVDNQDLCMVSVVRRPAPAASTADEAVSGAVCMMPSKGTGNKKKESKLAKRSGYIILTFLLFWLPLITTILVNVLVFQRRNTQMAIIQDVEILFISIACMTSLTDPIIYAAVNPQFRTEFYRMRNKLKAKWKKR